MKTMYMVMVVVVLAAAGAEGAGVNIGWDTCGPTGGDRASSSCTSNVGTRSFVVSFVPEQAFAGAALLGCRVGIRTADGSALPSWWQMEPGACRDAALDLEFHGLAGTPCDTIPSVQTVWDYVQGAGSPGSAVIIAGTGSSGPGVDLVPGQEYFVLKVNISFSKTAGTDSCGGCWVPMEIYVGDVSVYSQDDSFILTDPDRLGIILWQPDIVPARSTTWGQIKSLYRGRR